MEVIKGDQSGGGGRDASNWINEELVLTLSASILNHRDKITEIFEKVDACMQRLELCCQGPPCVRLVEYHNAMKPSCRNIKDNLKGYSDDLLTLIDKSHEASDIFDKMILSMTDDVEHQIKVYTSEKGEPQIGE